MTAVTAGINHLGITVADVQGTADFFVKVLGWTQGDFDTSYPKTAVTDGSCRLTIWGTKCAHEPNAFDRHANIGLHHLALHIERESDLFAVANDVANWPTVDVEFMPEPMGSGPRKHMMFLLHGGPRLELTWPGADP
jgi:catechol 2,3-dioxygenase-like lactoylglutathione lyase family enzyme